MLYGSIGFIVMAGIMACWYSATSAGAQQEKLKLQWKEEKNMAVQSILEG